MHIYIHINKKLGPNKYEQTPEQTEVGKEGPTGLYLVTLTKETIMSGVLLNITFVVMTVTNNKVQPRKQWLFARESASVSL